MQGGGAEFTEEDARFFAYLNQSILNDKEIIAFLPGSRKQEVSKMLETMLSVRNDFPDYQFVLKGYLRKGLSVF